MERKRGEIFEYNDEWYQCLEEKTCTCFGCDFRDYNCDDISLKAVKGSCQSERRKDNKSVIFKKLEKVGDPITVNGKNVQLFKTSVANCDNCSFYKDVNCDFCYPRKCHGGEEGTYVEIKQNKEDMEEKNDNVLLQERINHLSALIKTARSEQEAEHFKQEKNWLIELQYYKEHNNIKTKSFDLEAAKAGKPVCTRDGRKVRIICFDRINGDYYKIVACVTAFDGDFEEVLFYGIDGYIVDSQNPKDEDLMMLPEKKEGWVNICRNLNTNKTELDTEDIYNTKEEALQNLSSMTYVTTVKIEWEE